MITLKSEDVKIEVYDPNNTRGNSLENQTYGVKITHMPTGIIAKCHKYKSQILNEKECIEEIISKLPNIKRSCFNCRFYDGICCMYNCACRVVLDEEKTANDCEHYEQGVYNEEKLEKTDYK